MWFDIKWVHAQRMEQSAFFAKRIVAFYYLFVVVAFCFEYVQHTDTDSLVHFPFNSFRLHGHSWFRILSCSGYILILLYFAIVQLDLILETPFRPYPDDIIFHTTICFIAKFTATYNARRHIHLHEYFLLLHHHHHHRNQHNNPNE